MDIGRATTRAHPPHPLPARPYYTIQRIGPPRPCIVGAGEDVDVGMGPLWLPVRAHHSLSSPYLKCIDHKGPILSPLAPTIRRIGPPRPCIVGAREDVDVGMGPLWLPVRARH